MSTGGTSSKRGHMQTYDALYDCLVTLDKQNRALPVYKIHYSPKFHKLLIEKELIQSSNKDEKLSPLYGYKATSTYYIVSQKGKQYMEAYENMKNIIGY